MSDAIDRALSENHALIAAILEHHASGRHVPAVALLERLQLNLEFVAALSEHGFAAPPPQPPPAPPPDAAPARPPPAPARIAPALPVQPALPHVATMYWSPEEHARFEEGMRRYGQSRDGKPNFKAIASFVGTRTPVQVRSHLQKVQKKARRDAEGDHSSHPFQTPPHPNLPQPNLPHPNYPHPNHSQMLPPQHSPAHAHAHVHAPAPGPPAHAANQQTQASP